MTNAMQGTPAADAEHIAPAPRVSAQAFCETVETAASVQAAGEDRRLAKVHLQVKMGGIAAAVEAYRNAPTSNVIIIESETRATTSWEVSMRSPRYAMRARACWSSATTTTFCSTASCCGAA